MFSFLCRFWMGAGFAWRTALAGAALILPCAGAQAQDRTVIRIDASQPYQAPGPALYTEGTATSPDGTALGVNSRYLTRDGRPWLPVMGEFHFSRYPQAEWESEILKMKAAGVNIVATYVLWIHHEEVQGQFDWSGQRDLRAFAELCARHGMYVVARIGPWDHAEARNGGLPDWVLKQGPTRENDPAYLAAVRAWYAQAGGQLKGLLWKEGGPVIGIQLENEYSKRGPGAGAAHILELKKIARSSGLDVPLYLVTGWDNAVTPQGAVLPVYGGYPAAPWESSVEKLPPPDIYAFRFQSRVTASERTGGQGASGPARGGQDRVPYLTAEIGGGIQDTYHRRPVIQADDIAALFPVMLGSGVNLYGTYMFQGGENPDGKLTTLQESQATGYPNDLPIKSYDFQAPLGEFGQERASLRKIKVFQYFLNDFGSELAPMTVHAPAVTPNGSGDLSTPRASVRSRGDAGFLFFNNHVRGYAMPARHAVQFAIRLPGETLTVPSRPIDLPADAYFIWPLNLKVGGATLRFSTTQLFARLRPEQGPETLYFEALPGIPTEFAFDAATVSSVQVSSGTTGRAQGTIAVRGIEPGLDSWIDVVAHDGRKVRLVVLTAHEAEDAWKVRINGNEHLLLTDADVVVNPDAQTGGIWLHARGTPRFTFAVTPPVPLTASLPLRQTAADAWSARYTAQAQPWEGKLEAEQTRQAGAAPPIKLGPGQAGRRHGVAEAPAPGEMPQAAAWTISVPDGALSGLNEIYLEAVYQGDVARLTEKGRLLTDNFWNGQPWTVGLRRFLAPEGPSRFTLSILPLRKDAPVYLELKQPPGFGADGQVDKLESLRLIPEYTMEIETGGPGAKRERGLFPAFR